MARVTEWVFGIVGAIAAFLGLFVLYAGGDQYVGLGGDFTWRVGDIASGWGYGLLLVGVVMLVVAVASAVRDLRHPWVRKQQSEFAGLMAHLAIFAVVNAFLWVQDIVSGGGLEYAYWVTPPGASGSLPTPLPTWPAPVRHSGTTDAAPDQRSARLATPGAHVGPRGPLARVRLPVVREREAQPGDRPGGWRTEANRESCRFCRRTVPTEQTQRIETQPGGYWAWRAPCSARPRPPGPRSGRGSRNSSSYAVGHGKGWRPEVSRRGSTPRIPRKHWFCDGAPSGFPMRVSRRLPVAHR